MLDTQTDISIPWAPVGADIGSLTSRLIRFIKCSFEQGQFEQESNLHNLMNMFSENLLRVYSPYQQKKNNEVEKTWNVLNSSLWSPGPWECGWPPPGWSSCWHCIWWSLSRSCGWQERGWGWPRCRSFQAGESWIACAPGESCKCWHRSPGTIRWIKSALMHHESFCNHQYLKKIVRWNFVRNGINILYTVKAQHILQSKTLSRLWIQNPLFIVCFLWHLLHIIYDWPGEWGGE